MFKEEERLTEKEKPIEKEKEPETIHLIHSSKQQEAVVGIQPFQGSERALEEFPSANGENILKSSPDTKSRRERPKLIMPIFASQKSPLIRTDSSG